MADPVWKRFRRYRCASEELEFALDVSCMRFDERFLRQMEAPMAAALDAMAALEAGALANPDEGRRVGHYWLRAPELAPEPGIAREIEAAVEGVRRFAVAVRSGAMRAPGGQRFRRLLSIGIGGSALGPQLLADALAPPDPPLEPLFLDNTDPDGFDRVFRRIEEEPGATLTLVMSKSGLTRETHVGMLEAAARYGAAGLEFGPHAVAVTMPGSALDRRAEAEGWLARFPIWDWVGGRTSIFSPVGLLPAALLGVDIDAFLRGGREMDRLTRERDVRRNPAALLALMWYHAGNGRGDRDMVVLPYRDRLQLLARYLQQLVMESLGKETDLRGRVVRQGLTVYGNKGTTDQHAYVQQLREGPDNFFVTFVQVLRDRETASPEVEPGITAGDHLYGFLEGTREALAEAGRQSLTITLERLDAAALGRLIALFERAVGLYAFLVDVNAYHQPGVEAGKKAAERILALQRQVVEALRASGRPMRAEEAARAAGAPEHVAAVYGILRHLAANADRGIRRLPGPDPADDRFEATGA